MTSVSRPRTLEKLLLALTTVALASCGGGGGGDIGSAAANNLTNVPVVVPVIVPVIEPVAVVAPRPADLRITEISAKISATGPEAGWFEVYNPTTATFSLADYTLTSTAYAAGTSTTLATSTVATYSLPAATIAPGGFIVLAAKAAAYLVDGPQLKYIGSPTSFPSWSDSGFLELKRAVTGGQTADFVRFGSNTQTPSTPTQWTGTAAAALPSGTAAAAYGKSMVRLATGDYADTNSAADWTQVNFSTPGGKNDVAAGVVDADGDGVPSSAKVSGGTYAGLDLYAMGARPGQRDVFIEINAMDQDATAAQPDLGFVVRREALQKVVDAFSPKGIRLHIDAGSRFSATFDPANFNLGGSNAAGSIPFAKCTYLPSSPADVILAGCSNFFEHKNKNLDVRRRVMFSYMLFANSQLTSGLGGSSGLAEVNGNDAMITMGGYGFTISPTTGRTASQNTQYYINLQAGTVMHEFGHNLGLRHGGFENQNYKPNYLSVMNYMYQFPGIPGVQNDSTVGDRYIKYVAGLNNAPTSYCALSNSPCTSTFIIDYSDGSSSDLNENALVGSSLMGRGVSAAAAAANAFINWIGLATVTAATPAYAFDVNRDSLRTTLKDYNDWVSVNLPFVRSALGFNTGAASNSTPVATSDVSRRDVLNDAASKQFVREEPPTAEFLRALRD